MPIQAAQYKIRHLRRHEIEQLLQLCKAEGRHMGTVTEVETWMQIDPQGFFVAVNQEGNCCSLQTDWLAPVACFLAPDHALAVVVDQQYCSA